MKFSLVPIAVTLMTTGGCASVPSDRLDLNARDETDAVLQHVIDARKQESLESGSYMLRGSNRYRYGDDQFTTPPVYILDDKLPKAVADNRIRVKVFDILHIRPATRGSGFNPFGSSGVVGSLLTNGGVPWGSAHLKCVLSGDQNGNSISTVIKLPDEGATIEQRLTRLVNDCITDFVQQVDRQTLQ